MFQLIKDDQYYPIGTTAGDNRMHFSVISQGERCSLVLYRKGQKEILEKIDFPQESRVGDVWNLTVSGDFSEAEYCFEIDGALCPDPFGMHFSGREAWGDEGSLNRVLKASAVEGGYDWEGDKRPEIPFEECIIYRLHPRGFTKHPSSGVAEEKRGTFAGIQEKIPYLKELGITTVELLPSIEFQEVMEKPVTGHPVLPVAARGMESGESQAEASGKAGREPSGKVNYWGFIPGLYCAPKASYCAGRTKHPEREFKDLVKALHREGMELVMDLFFSGKEPEAFVLEVLRFWAREYHVDGFHLIGFAPRGLVSRDPYLGRAKLFAQSWDEREETGQKHLAEYNDGFSIDMKRVLKGDESQMGNLAFRTRHNPGSWGTVNYMANINGFTLMDLVCYERKHNEANGENNLDGSDYNFSWNCGVEGPTKKKKVNEMRRRLLRDAYLLLFLSQGTPLLMAGDEFGNSQGGNNNPYCQDNEVSWLDWSLTEENQDLLEFVKGVIRFRKAHPMFHMPKEPRIMDYLSCGLPDVSYHGEKAWCPEFEHFRRQLGILYCGKYGKLADGSFDDTFFVAYNMHWEPHEFSLPNLPKGRYWHIVISTEPKAAGGEWIPKEEVLLKQQKQYMVPPRAIMVFVGKEVSEERLEKLRKSGGEKKVGKGQKAEKGKKGKGK